MSLSNILRGTILSILLNLSTLTVAAENFQIDVQRGSFWEYGWNRSGCSTDFPGCSRGSGVFRIVAGEAANFAGRTGFEVSRVRVSGDNPEELSKFVWNYLAVEGAQLWGSIDSQSWLQIVDLNASQQAGGGFFFYDPRREVSIYDSAIDNEFLDEPAIALRNNYGPGGGGCEFLLLIEICTPTGESVILVDYFQSDRGPVGHSTFIQIPNFVVRKTIGLLRFSSINTELPNLAPAIPRDWSDAIVISTQTGTSQDAETLTSADSLYVDFAVGNFGGMDVTEEYSISLSLDGEVIGVWTAPPPLQASHAHFAEDIAMDSLLPGEHELVLEADINQEVQESNENDNSYTRRFNLVEPVPALVFPQWLNGVAGGLLNGTRIILRNNNAQSMSGTIRFQDGSGNSVAVPIQGVLMDLIPFSIEPWGTLEVKTDGTGQLQNGTVEVYSALGEEAFLEGTEIFSVLGSYVSVPASPPRATNQVYVSFGSAENTGVALYNPDQLDSVRVKLVLVATDGNHQVERTLTIGPREQIVAFLDQNVLFERFLGGRRDDFKGTLHVLIEGQGSLSVLGLLQKRASGALLATVVSDKVRVP